LFVATPIEYVINTTNLEDVSSTLELNSVNILQNEKPFVTNFKHKVLNKTHLVNSTELNLSSGDYQKNVAETLMLPPPTPTLSLPMQATQYKKRESKLSIKYSDICAL